MATPLLPTLLRLRLRGASPEECSAVIVAAATEAAADAAAAEAVSGDITGDAAGDAAAAEACKVRVFD